VSAPFSVALVSWHKHQAALAMIRTSVFMDEQMVPPELEWDGLDDAAIHVLATTPDGKPIGCGRMLITTDDPGHIGRMAVLQPWRGQGVGSTLLIALLNAAQNHALKKLNLDAQVTAIGFYEHHGFSAHGPEFMDAGIPHRHMRQTINPPG